MELIPEVAGIWGQRLTPPQAELAAPAPGVWAPRVSTGHHRQPHLALVHKPQANLPPPSLLLLGNLRLFEAGREMRDSQGARSSAESGSQLLSYKANLNQWAAFNYLVV